MFSYYSKLERKYRGFHTDFYCDIGFLLGTLIHALFTWRFGMPHLRAEKQPVRKKYVDLINLLLLFVCLL